jgi:MFS family permease
MNTTVFYGLILALAGIVISLVSFFAGLQSDHIKYIQWVNWTSLAATFVILYLGGEAKRKEQNPPYLSFGKAFGTLFLIGLLSTVLGSVWQFIHVSFIHPDFGEYMKIYQQEQMAAQGMSDAQIEKVVASQAFMFKPVMLLIMGLLMGTIFSAILALLHGMALIRRHKLAKLLMIYAGILGGLGLVFGGLGGLMAGKFLIGAAKGLAINVAVAALGWGLLLKFTGYAPDAPEDAVPPPM